jgi:hypothetical protein
MEEHGLWVIENRVLRRDIWTEEGRNKRKLHKAA